MTHTKPQDGAIILLGELPASPSAVRGRMSATSVMPNTSRPTTGWSTVAGVWCIRLGDKECNQRLQTPICILSSLFQWDSVVTDSWSKGSCFEGGNHYASEQGSYLSSAALATGTVPPSLQGLKTQQ